MDEFSISESLLLSIGEEHALDFDQTPEQYPAALENEHDIPANGERNPEPVTWCTIA